MKLRYDKEDDVLMIWFSKKPVDYAEKAKNIIIHFTKDHKPVLVEILEASQFLKQTSQLLPEKIRHQAFSL